MVEGEGNSGATVIPGSQSTWDSDPWLGELLQKIAGTTSKISVPKSAVLGTAKILCRTLKLPSLW